MTPLKNTLLNHIFLFEQASELAPQNALKEFIYFLKFKGVKGIIDFSYSNGKGSLHQNLTIKENLILDAVPTSLIKDGENNLKEFLGQLNNSYVVLLIEKLGPLGQNVSQLDVEKVKLASIIKALLSPSEYVFLIAPEEDQSLETVQIVKDAIGHELTRNHRKFLIRPHTSETWMDISTHLVNKCENSFQFHESENQLRQVNTEQNLHVVKKAA